MNTRLYAYLSLSLSFVWTSAIATDTGLIVNEPVPVWHYQSSAPIYGDGAIDQNRYYVANTAGDVMAFDKTSGLLKWLKALGTPVYSDINLGQGALYLQAEDGFSYKLDRDNGDILWRVKTGGDFLRKPDFSNIDGPNFDYKASAPVESDGLVFVGGTQNRAFALDVSTGAIRWNYEALGIIRTDVAVVDNQVIFADFAGMIHSLDQNSGELLWLYDTVPTSPDTAGSTWINSSPVYHDGMLYVGSRNSNIYAIESQTGQLGWFFQHSTSWVETDATIYDNTLYFGSSFLRAQRAIDASIPEVIWENYRVKGLSYADLVVDETRLFAATAAVPGLIYDGFLSDARMAKLNREDGSLVWEWELEPGEYLNEYGVVSAPQLEQNTLFFGGLDGGVYALEDAHTEYPILNFSIDRSDLKPKEKTVLRWHVIDDHKVLLNGRKVPNKGHKVIRGKSDQEFTLEASGRLEQKQTISVSVKPQEQINLAKFALATASSVQEAFELEPEFAIDGNLNTRWAADHLDGESITLDLGRVFDLDRINIVWEYSHASHYTIESSLDGSEWLWLYEDDNNPGGTSELTELSRKAQYIRITGNVRGRPWGVSIYEIEAYEGPLPLKRQCN